jgi:hypothetical protein
MLVAMINVVKVECVPLNSNEFVSRVPGCCGDRQGEPMRRLLIIGGVAGATVLAI